MNNYINYFSHFLIDPIYFQRNYENDFLKINISYFKQAKRIALIALPLIGLHTPSGKNISIVLGSFKGVIHLKEAVIAVYSKNMLNASTELIQTAFAVFAVAGTVFNFKLGLLINTLQDLAENLLNTVLHLQQRNYMQALEELLQCASSALYLSIMIYGSLEIVLASLLIQGIIQLFQAKKEFNEGRWPEFLVKLTLAGVRFKQANHHYQLIQKRNCFIALERFSKLFEQIRKARKHSDLIHSNLHQAKEETILEDAENNPYNFGAHIYGKGKQIVKGMNLCFKTHSENDDNLQQLEFKVNHVVRERLNDLIELMKGFDESETGEFLRLVNSHATHIKVQQIPFSLSNDPHDEIGMGIAQKITFEGLGSITIGDSPLYPNLYDRIRVEMAKDKTLYDMHELLSFLNLEDAIKTSSEEDIERLKIGHLFRIYHPIEATLLERSEDYFTQSVEELKSSILKITPDMDKVFSEELSTMELQEILPGKMRYTNPSVEKKVFELGGRGLIASITGAATDDETFDRVASILKMGLLSSEVRYDNGIKSKGLSPSIDFIQGGADSVFTQFITKENIDSRMPLDNLYWGTVRVLFPLAPLNGGTYQYHDDSYGERRITPIKFSYRSRNGIEESIATPSSSENISTNYMNRPDIFSFTSKEQSEGFNRGNEVMIKERIDPKLIKGLIVSDEFTKNNLINQLRLRGLVINNCGIETIMGKQVDKFIHVEDHLTEQMFA